MSFFFSKKNATAQEDETQDALVALDIGSSKIRLIAGEVGEGGVLTLTYYAEQPSLGMDNGAITDLTKLSEQISLLIADYKENGRDIAVSKDATPVLGSEETFMEKYFGGVGYMPVQPTRKNDGL